MPLSAVQLALGTVPLSDVPLMAIDVSPVSPLTSGNAPASGVLLMAMLCKLAGIAPSAVKPAPLTSSDCTAGSEGNVPASRPVSCSIRLVSAGKLHSAGAVTDPTPRNEKLCSAGRDEIASNAPLKQPVMREQSMRKNVSDVQLAMPVGRLPTPEVSPTSEGS